MVEASSSKPVTPAKRASSESSSVAEDGFERLAELTSSADNTKGVLDLGNPPFPHLDDRNSSELSSSGTERE